MTSSPVTSLEGSGSFNTTLTTEMETLQTSLNFKGIIVPAVFAFLVASSNFLIIFAFAVEKRLRVYTNYYVVNMAIADTLVGLVVMGFSLSQRLMNYRWPFGHVSCSIILSITHTSLHVSVVMIAIISIDRWYAVYYPLRHLHQRNKKNAIRRNTFVWLLCFVFWGLFVGVWRLVDEARHYSVVCGPIYNRYIAGTLVALSAFYLIPVTIIGVMNFCIYLKIRSSGGGQISKKFKADTEFSQDISSAACDTSHTSITSVSKGDTYRVSFGSGDHTGDKSLKQSENGKPTNKTVSEKDKEDRGEGVQKRRFLQKLARNRRTKTSGGRSHEATLDGLKAQRTLTLLILVLVITWTPYTTVILTSTYCYTFLQVTRSCVPGWLLSFSLWFNWANSLLNPFMYAIAQPLFRKTIVKTFWRNGH